MLVTMGSIQLEEFYPAVAVSALMRIVRDSSLSSHHTMVIQVCLLLWTCMMLSGKAAIIYETAHLLSGWTNILRVCSKVRRKCEGLHVCVENGTDQNKDWSSAVQLYTCMTCFQGEALILLDWYVISIYSCLKYIAVKLEQYKLFCCCCVEVSSKDYNYCVNGVLIIIFAINFAFLSSGCHIYFQEFRNEMCDIPISGNFFL